jgi:NAD(P)-dependent dehydrogenase (short-subunit alcohol dehydrogenase family)
MLLRKWGRIINIASIVATIGSDRGSAYAASKAGLIAFTKSVALEVAKDGVTANAICPGPVRTRVSDLRLTQIAAERKVAFADLESGSTPMGRRLDPIEIAHVARFLATDRAAAITGQAWHVDAGTVRY